MIRLKNPGPAHGMMGRGTAAMIRMYYRHGAIQGPNEKILVSS